MAKKDGKKGASGAQGKGRSAGSKERRSPPAGRSSRRWSHEVMKRSDALDLEEGVFKKPSARQVAQSLKQSAESSHRRKADPYRSAMSMLTFHINRAGRTLPAERRRTLEDAKDELRRLYGRKPQKPAARRRGQAGASARR